MLQGIFSNPLLPRAKGLPNRSLQLKIVPVGLDCPPQKKSGTKLLGCFMYRRHNFEERLHIVSRLISGNPLESLCQELHIDKKMVRQCTEKKGCKAYVHTTMLLRKKEIKDIFHEHKG